MALNGWKNKLKQAFGTVMGDETRRSDGGTSCYRPMKRRMMPETAGMQNYEYTQPVQYVHTGFTGMNPPASYGGDMPGYGAQTAFEQTAYTQTAFAGAQGFAAQPAYPQADTFPPQPAFGASDPFSQPGNSQPQNLFQNRPEPEERTAARPDRGWFPARDQARQPDNISYMPGFAPEGAAGGHVEHIMTMTGLRSCYEAIACMKNGETLIVMMDAIANESESMRCQDMLAGAAFTLGCSVRMLQGGRLVLIAPEGVKVLPEQAQVQPEMPMFTSAPAPQVQPAEPAPARRERRTGARAEEWNAARNGQLNNYNPYTGTMPVAAGAYGSFGGYGY